MRSNHVPKSKFTELAYYLVVKGYREIQNCKWMTRYKYFVGAPSMAIFTSILVPNRLKAQAGTWQARHCLKEVHFGGSSGTYYIPIIRDDSTGDYGAPQFVNSYSNCNSDSGASIITIDLLAYVSETNERVNACFITDCTHISYTKAH